MFVNLNNAFLLKRDTKFVIWALFRYKAPRHTLDKRRDFIE